VYIIITIITIIITTTTIITITTTTTTTITITIATHIQLHKGHLPFNLGVCSIELFGITTTTTTGGTTKEVDVFGEEGCHTQT